MYVKTKAIVIDNTPSSQKQNKVILFTEEFGKISVFLKSYGTGVNHWAGVFEMGNFLEVTMLKRFHSFLITGFKLLKEARDRELEEFALKALVFEATNEILPLEEKNTYLFKWLKWTLSNLSEKKVAVYLAHLIYREGFFPFENNEMKNLIKKGFEEFLKHKEETEVLKIIEKEVRHIERFAETKIKSFELIKRLKVF